MGQRQDVSKSFSKYICNKIMFLCSTCILFNLPSTEGQQEINRNILPIISRRDIRNNRAIFANRFRNRDGWRDVRHNRFRNADGEFNRRQIHPGNSANEQYINTGKDVQLHMPMSEKSKITRYTNSDVQNKGYWNADQNHKTGLRDNTNQRQETGTHSSKYRTRIYSNSSKHRTRIYSKVPTTKLPISSENAKHTTRIYSEVPTTALPIYSEVLTTKLPILLSHIRWRRSIHDSKINRKQLSWSGFGEIYPLPQSYHEHRTISNNIPTTTASVNTTDTPNGNSTDISNITLQISSEHTNTNNNSFNITKQQLISERTADPPLTTPVLPVDALRNERDTEEYEIDYSQMWDSLSTNIPRGKTGKILLNINALERLVYFTQPIRQELLTGLSQEMLQYELSVASSIDPGIIGYSLLATIACRKKQCPYKDCSMCLPLFHVELKKELCDIHVTVIRESPYKCFGHYIYRKMEEAFENAIWRNLFDRRYLLAEYPWPMWKKPSPYQIQFGTVRAGDDRNFDIGVRHNYINKVYSKEK